MKISTKQPTDLYVAVDMPCLGCGYNLRTLAVSSACPECSHQIEDTLRKWEPPSDPYDLICLCSAAGGLAWIPVLLLASTSILIVLAWLLHSVVLVAPLFCWSLVLGAAYVAASYQFVECSSKLTRARAPYISLLVVLLLSGGLGCVSYLRGSAETAVLSAALLATLLMTCTSWYAHSAASRFGEQDLREYARLCFRIALTASAVQTVAGCVCAAFWFTPGISFANRAVRNYAVVTLLVAVGPTVVAHFILMLRIKASLSRFTETRMDADRAR